MKTKIILIGLFILAIGFFSCKKDTVIPNQTENKPKSMAELTAASNFSWQTSKNLSIKIQGSHTMSTTVKSAKGDVYFKGMVSPSQSIQTVVVIPSNITEIIVEYGPFTKVVTITNNAIDCTFNLNNY